MEKRESMSEMNRGKEGERMRWKRGGEKEEERREKEGKGKYRRGREDKTEKGTWKVLEVLPPHI